MGRHRWYTVVSLAFELQVVADIGTFFPMSMNGMVSICSDTQIVSICSDTENGHGAEAFSGSHTAPLHMDQLYINVLVTMEHNVILCCAYVVYDTRVMPTMYVWLASFDHIESMTLALDMMLNRLQRRIVMMLVRQ